MKNLRLSTILIIIGIIIVFLISWLYITYNSLVRIDENVKTSWVDVQTLYQRRDNLIPNLVNTVQKYAMNEPSMFTSLINVRLSPPQIIIDIDNLTPEKIKIYQKSESEFSRVLSEFITMIGQYSELKTNKKILKLQVQLEEIENKLAKSRSRYNQEVSIYNIKVCSFPTNMIANFLHFSRKSQF